MKYSIEILQNHLDLLERKVETINRQYALKQMTDGFYQNRYNDLQRKIIDLQLAIRTLNFKINQTV
jgi:hypothetical protein